MDQTFITIHNLTPDATILFASESIIDILGYYPQEVQGKSCFDFFHPDEVPFARSVHSRGILLDKAAVLQYARVQTRHGSWVNCECCFTIVNDVLVASTGIYRRGEKSDRRAIEAPQIRRLFSCSPRDPRYHMLEHLSPKFTTPALEREPRAALILNRFTRSLSIMFSTNAVASILGLSPEELTGKSFYDCIHENCLDEALECLEGAKANDSISYLRFWSRDPRRPEDCDEEDGSDDEGEDDKEKAKNEGAIPDDPPIVKEEVGLSVRMDTGHPELNSPVIKIEEDVGMEEDELTKNQYSIPERRPSPLSPNTSNSQPPTPESNRQRYPLPSYELEAVVSCTSDGLVIVLRRARPQVPEVKPQTVHVASEYSNLGAPWAQQQNYSFQSAPMPHLVGTGGPPVDQFMNSIRDVAVFAWALVGIVPRGDDMARQGLHEDGSGSGSGNGGRCWGRRGPLNEAYDATRWHREGIRRFRRPESHAWLPQRGGDDEWWNPGEVRHRSPSLRDGPNRNPYMGFS